MTLALDLGPEGNGTFILDFSILDKHIDFRIKKNIFDFLLNLLVI